MIQKLKIVFLFTLIFTVSQSCKKGCDYPKENTITGDIISDASVLGFNTGGVKSVHYTDDPNNLLQVSFDKGYTYIPIDFSKYTAMNFPVSVGCNTYFEKNVTINNAASKVTYTLVVNSCPDCEDQYRQDNWVLVPKFSTNFQVVYERK